MTDIILISILKVLDNFLLTSKTILVQKNKAVLAALVVMLSQFMFYFVISKIISKDSMAINAVVAVASGIGSFFAMKIHDKFSKDKLYMNVITYKQKEHVIELCEFLRVHKIRYIVTDTYNRDWTTSMVVQVFAATKDESQMLDRFIEEKGRKHLREVIG